VRVIPRRIVSSTSETIYFDNCLVGAVVKHDHPAELPALAALFREAAAGTVTLVASTEVLGEILELPPSYQGPHFEVYSCLMQLPAANVRWIDTTTSPPTTVDLDYATLRTILPDEMDRRHVLHAVKNGVQNFATVDKKTILRYSGELESAFPGTRFGTPTDITTILGIPII